MVGVLVTPTIRFVLHHVYYSGAGAVTFSRREPTAIVTPAFIQATVLSLVFRKIVTVLAKTIPRRLSS
nr:MAG TPA: hypothetical protein [Bacteriophage sp.]